jgi:membrane protease YdiL (CAAX protease family)
MVGIGKKILYATGWLLWLTVCYLLASVVISTTLDLLPFEIHDDDTVLLAIISALVYVATLAILVLLPWVNRQRLKLPSKITELVGLSQKIAWQDVKKAISTFILYMVVLVGVMSLFAFVDGVFGWNLSDQEQNLGFEKTGNSWWQLAVIFVSLVIVPPIAEELMMRGFLFGRLRQKLPFWAVSITVSLMFALAHGQVNVAVDTFVLSLFLCNLREKTGAVWSPIIVHMLKNLLGFLLVFVVVI